MKLKIVMYISSVSEISTYLISRKMKDEFNRNKVDEFVALKSKMYSLISFDGWEENKAKGVNFKPRHKEYVDVLLRRKVARRKMKRIQSNLDRIGTYE